MTVTAPGGRGVAVTAPANPVTPPVSVTVPSPPGSALDSAGKPFSGATGQIISKQRGAVGG